MMVEKKFADFRSDTVTRPSAAMLDAMMTSPVGDDVWGDDPTVNLLQEEVAALLGKEAALFVPSGTMSNQLALKARTSPGDQIVLEYGAHINRYEAGGPALLSGLLVTTVEAPDSVLTWPLVEKALNPDNVHCAPPRMVCLENTHNVAGGTILPQENVIAIAEGAHERGLWVHMDGARIWHTHVATGTPLADLCAPVDSVSVCFSKGLGAPVGSVLASDRETIVRAHRFRKIFGGAMRQVGILAGACRYALEHHVGRLDDDHAAATRLAVGLDHPDLKVNHPVDTNIVIIDVAKEAEEALLAHLEKLGVLGVGFGPGRVRLIPNLDTSAADLDRALEALNSYTGASS
jgi:threonine aldolase